MARLIDADALMYSIRHAIYPSDMTTTVAIGICESHLKDAPTVDAIPVEWLKTQLTDESYDELTFRWQKEQEAR